MRYYANVRLPAARVIGKALCLVLTVTSFTACVAPTETGKTTKEGDQTAALVDVISAPTSGSGGSTVPPIDTSGDGAGTPTGPACTVDKFRQDGQYEYLRKVDILFMADHSGSMLDNWEKVVVNLQELVKEIPGDVDVQYGVILGDVGAWSGKLYSYGNAPRVLSNQTMTTEAIGAALFDSFAHAMNIEDPSSGEAVFYSLQEAVTTQLKANQALGFFRPDAALAVVMVSDEQEIGSPFPAVQAPGLPPRCDTAFEDNVKKRYYDAKGITVDTAYAAVKAAKGDMPFGAHALVNITKEDLFVNNSPLRSCLYESLGYGFFDMAKKTGGALYSIKVDFGKSMAVLGQAIRKDLTLTHDFKLSKPAEQVDAATIQATVDGRRVAHRYEPAVATVRLEDAGQPNSAIEIAHCEPFAQTPTPTPTPTPAPAPTPTPTPTPTPETDTWSIVGFDGTTSDTKAEMIWQTQNVATKATLHIGLSPTNLTLRKVETSEAKTVQYEIVDGLAPNTRYYFKVIASDANGRTVESNVISKETKE